MIDGRVGERYIEHHRLPTASLLRTRINKSKRGVAGPKALLCYTDTTPALVVYMFMLQKGIESFSPGDITEDGFILHNIENIWARPIDRVKHTALSSPGKKRRENFSSCILFFFVPGPLEHLTVPSWNPLE